MSSHPDLYTPLPFARGPDMKNRFMLAPMTNHQSLPDGRLGDDELHWLEQRAKGGFGLTMTCAAHVSANGQGFPGQLGVYDDRHIPGLERLATAIRRHGSIAVAQLHHGGMRSPPDLIASQPVCPSDDDETGARALTESEIEGLIDDFIDAAYRSERAGFDGVELHGAHGYLLCEFLSPDINRRTDRFGGEIDRRADVLFYIIDGIRSRCRADFGVGVRLSPERFGLRLAEVRHVAERLVSDGKIDYLDLSLWDIFKDPEEEDFRDRNLLAWFTSLDRGRVRMGAAGKIRSAANCAWAMEQGLDFVVIGRAAILHHDFPDLAVDPDFESTGLPVTAAYLEAEGLGPAFVDYMRTWEGFVAD